MASKFVLLALLIYCQILEDVVCFSNVGRRDGNSATPDYVQVWQKFTKSKKPFPQSWDIPKNLQEEYGKWIVEYKAKKSRDKKLELNVEYPIDKNMPQDFVGVPPDPILDPPPWAIVPTGYDKPNFCFQAPKVGSCEFFWRRWGYNWFIGDCQMFYYFGCGGNGNNFKTKGLCQAACKDDAKTNCEKSGEYLEYVQFVLG